MVWQIITTILTALIAVAGFSLSLYLALNNKPRLSIEKISASKRDATMIDFHFYLDNIGEKPTTIKSIEFYTDEFFMPHNNIIIRSNSTEPFVQGSISMKENRKGFELPFHLLPNTSLKLEAQLNFISSDRRDGVIKPNDGKGQIHFNIKIKHSRGIFEEKI
jgi:hypothetical protein